jgi:two-component system cell cycle response regulator DivK
MNQLSVLIVEDNRSHMQLAVYVLKRSGYAVLQATTADKGITIARSERPDLILMDIGLPGKDGLTAIRELKADPQTSAIGIIIVTSYRNEPDGQLMLKSGADGFIAKPFHYEHVLGVVRAVLERA